jgi:hypothetical protein
MKKLLTAFALTLVLCATAAGSSTRNVNLLRTFAPQLTKVKRTTRVPVLLPPSVPLFGTYKLYPASFATGRTFGFLLAAAPRCGGADACFIASFEGRRGGTLPGRPNARLAGGDPAFFHPISCGASCAPNSFWFTHKGYLYSWQVKDLHKPEKAILIRMANQAIAAGAR